MSNPRYNNSEKTIEVGADDFDWSDGQNLPRTIDPVMTIAIVKKYVENERNRNRKVLMWISMLFLFVVILILTLFISIGMYVIMNSRKAAEIAAGAETQAALYASEVIVISNKVEQINKSKEKVEQALKKTEAVRQKEGAVLKTDLQRFSQWVASGDAESRKSVEELMKRLGQMEQSIKDRDEEIENLKASYANALASIATQPKAVPAVNTQLVSVAGQIPPVAVTGELAAVTLPLTNAVVATEPYVTQAVSRLPEIVTVPKVDVITPTPPTNAGEVSSVNYPNGDSYRGTFKNGLFDGWGVYNYANGDAYEGEYRGDVKNGNGTFTYSSGDKYTGQFVNDQRQGSGSLILRNGDRYIGEFRDNGINGKGTMNYTNGNKYTGEFKNGLRHGNGTTQYPNGDTYRGEFVGDMRSGNGVYAFRDGSKYIGEYKDDLRHGKGRYIYPEGDEYVGEFKEGKRDGVAEWIYTDGRRIKGIWKEDKFVSYLNPPSE